MKIDLITPKELYGVYSKAPGKPEVASKKSMETDRVELSEDAIAFSAALKAAKQAMETNDADRIKRINEIKQQIDNGSYDISGESIAEKILER